MSHAATPSIAESDVRLPLRHGWRKVPLAAGLIGVAALVAAFVLGRQVARPHLYASYLTAYLYWLSLALGALFFVIVQFAARAGWSVVVRRIAENAMITLPVFALLFVPIAVGGMHELYHWTHAEALKDPLLAGKAPYLNVGFFYGRALAYFVIWTALALFYFRASVRQDKSGEVGPTKRLQAWAGPSIWLFGLTVTFAAFDWIMSLNPHWYSTIFGIYYFAGCVVACFALLALVGVLLRRAGLLTQVITIEHFHDLGKLLFAFTVFWTYIAFSQFMLIWYGNLPEETIWYAHRVVGSWRTVTIALAVGHFGVPFFYLMTRRTKRNTNGLLLGALWLLVLHYLDLYWLVMPTFHHEGVHLTALDALTWLGIGGIFVALFAAQLGRYALVPIKDPRLAESLTFENF